MATEDAPLTGGCGCGAVRFTVSAPLVGAAYCHCTRCQRRTGGGSSVSALVQPGTFTITQGQDAVGTWSPEDGWEKMFCARCGSALYGVNPQNPDQVIVRLGVFDADPGVRPLARQFVAYAPPWEPVPDDGLPRFDESLPL
jgi:hypothetical protein